MHLKALCQFLAGLSENNHRAWFVANRPSYDILRGEFLELIAAVRDRLALSDPSVAGVVPAKAAFRIHQDRRFAPDRPPYRTEFSAELAPPGPRQSGPMYYFHFDSSGQLQLAAGLYRPTGATLKAMREHVASDLHGLTKALRQAKLKSVYGELDPAEQFVRVPTPFPADHPAASYLRLKSLIVHRTEVIDDRMARAGTAQQAARIAEKLAAASPLVHWLREPR